MYTIFKWPGVFGLPLFACSLLGALAGCESTTNKPVVMPSAMQQALQQKFGQHLEQLRWQTEQGRMHASFIWKTIPIDVWLTAAGKVMETQLAMTEEDVPAVLRDSLQRYYGSYHRHAIYLVETRSGFHYALLLSPPNQPAARYLFGQDGRRMMRATQ